MNLQKCTEGRLDNYENNLTKHIKKWKLLSIKATMKMLLAFTHQKVNYAKTWSAGRAHGHHSDLNFQIKSVKPAVTSVCMRSSTHKLMAENMKIKSQPKCSMQIWMVQTNEIAMLSDKQCTFSSHISSSNKKNTQFQWRLVLSQPDDYHKSFNDW